jgi:hypothetical protein
LLENQTTGVTITSVPLPASGAFTITTALLPAAAAPYNLIAHYGGDGNFAASDSTPPISMTVPQQASKILVDFLTFTATGGQVPNTTAVTVAYGSPYIVRVDVTNTNGTSCENANTGAISFVCPMGTIQLFQNPGVPLNDFPTAQTTNATSISTLNDRGFAEDQPIQLAPGVYNISAAYTAAANSSFTSSTNSNTVAVTVTKATTTAAVASNVTSVVSGASVTLTAIISSSSNGEPPCGSGVANLGTVQFKNGSTAISGTVSYTGTSGAQTGQASCTATLTTALSQLVPLMRPQPKMRIPAVPLWIAAWLAILFLALARHSALLRRRWPHSAGRLGYAAIGLLLFACLAGAFAGCSGNGTSGTGAKSHTDSITAVYSGDANYAGSTSAAATVTVQ